MDRLALEESDSRFAAFIGSLNGVIGHRDRIGPFRDYCAGLLAGCERKSVEPLAAITAPSRFSAQHQSLLHFVGKASWSDEAVLGKVLHLTLPILEKHGAIEAWIVDDTGFPKKGRHSVGVARQYCGQLGKQDNCQAAVSLSIANHHASLPVAYRLYLPQEWTDDEERRKKAGVPDDIAFMTKPEIALAQIAQAVLGGLPQGTVLMDAGYGVNTALREGVTALGLRYVAGILPQTSVWKKDTGPLPLSLGWDKAGLRSCCAAMKTISPDLSKLLRLDCRNRLLKQLLGAKARAGRWRLASPGFVSGPPIAMISSRHQGPKNGF